MGGGHLTPLTEITLMMADTVELVCSEIYACLVPRTMTDAHEIAKKEAVATCTIREARALSLSLLPIVTVYETGVHHFDPESMLQ